MRFQSIPMLAACFSIAFAALQEQSRPAPLLLDSEDLIRLEWVQPRAEVPTDKEISALSLSQIRALKPSYETVAIIRRKVELSAKSGKLGSFARELLALKRPPHTILDRIVAEQICIYCERAMFWVEKPQPPPRFYSETSWLGYEAYKVTRTEFDRTEVGVFLNLSTYGPARSVRVDYPRMYADFHRLSGPVQIALLHRRIASQKYLKAPTDISLDRAKGEAKEVEANIAVAKKWTPALSAVAVLEASYFVRSGRMEDAKKVCQRWRTDDRVPLRFREGMVDILQGKGGAKLLKGYMTALPVPHPRD